MKAYSRVSSRKTSQIEPIIDQVERQVENNAGGFVYKVSPLKALERFLILGSEGGTYYVGEHKLTKDNAIQTIKTLNEQPDEAINLIVRISDEGRAPKNDPAIFALALAASSPNQRTRALALAALPKVCRIPTHLFHFVQFVRQFRGFGRGLRKAIAGWYNDLPVDKLAYEVVKYQSRDGWSNSDLLRLSHPKTNDPIRNSVYKYIVDGWEPIAKGALSVPSIIGSFEFAKDLRGGELANTALRTNLSREMVPTEGLNDPDVWDALLQRMPLTAMIRNLGNMSKVGLLTPMSTASRLVVDKLHDRDAIKKARIHPINVLIAMKTYDQGHGLKGKGEWTTVPAVVDALDDAFYLAFEAMEPTGKRLLFGVDVSGSMGAMCGTLPITCAEGAAAMALACVKSEREYYIHGFTGGADGSGGRWGYRPRPGSTTDGFVDLGITPKMRLTDALAITRSRNFGRTDCAVPMRWATKNKVGVDGFIVITDNETWQGDMHASQALREYREKMGIEAKEVVIGMTATNFTIADPNDPLTLDVCGFDTTVPQVLGEFLR